MKTCYNCRYFRRNDHYIQNPDLDIDRDLFDGFCQYFDDSNGPLTHGLVSVNKNDVCSCFRYSRTYMELHKIKKI